MTTEDGHGRPLDENPTCLDENQGGCEGEVEYRESLSGTGTPIPRCEGHWAKRLEWQREHDKRYPEQAPSDFDPAYAGERWGEED